uniref:Uncharacterized protein n=1 Tax=Chromera velia CCMP2878 TaxID=1169474 RepID=A0A0G4GES6_9ALVE|eukprot:Cvel_21561.t1-p1 / transcript=Cvel_21561.t1 / gene=Cvel_21561 / organism=Chromera_velia_CCMP2878 / gene_product=hypothetical protein / transcript_product=hypothetical protein / location=Cvel_scaffold2033:29193-29799(-) / protein_length=68 / sequence_SO=supercontig / SO=protein_coding / is_pseudo=false
MATLVGGMLPFSPLPSLPFTSSWTWSRALSSPFFSLPLGFSEEEEEEGALISRSTLNPSQHALPVRRG